MAGPGGKGGRMQKLSLDALAREHLERAAAATNGRSATTVYGGHAHTLRQTLLALKAGTSLAEHDSPGEATLLVLRGVSGSPAARPTGRVAAVTSSPSLRRATG